VKHSEPTLTKVVLDALIAHDDFMRLDTLVEATKLGRHAVQSTLLYLRKHKAIDSVESGGHLYWFPTPKYDQRSKQYAERAPEAKQRAYKGRTRAPRSKPLAY